MTPLATYRPGDECNCLVTTVVANKDGRVLNEGRGLLGIFYCPLHKAARELLAALRAAEAAIRHLSNVAAIPSWKPELDRLAFEARAAIALAEGQS